MIETTIFLDNIDPAMFYGANNVNIDLIKKSFPKLKIVARGNNIKVMGTNAEVVDFETKMAGLIEYCSRANVVSKEIIKDFLEFQHSDFYKEQETNTKDVLIFGNYGKPIKARTPNQKKLIAVHEHNDLVFAIGPAGTGKTYTAVALAVKALKNKEVRRIILCRPAVEADEKLGFLPGDMREKLNPYMQPLYDALMDMIHPRKLAEMFEDNIIQIAPLAYMRGRTLADAFVILDEAQNATLNQLKMFLTRMGENAKFIITGDITQIDLPDKSKSGLTRTIKALEKVKGIDTIFFENRDIVRHKLVKSIVKEFEKLNTNKPK